MIIRSIRARLTAWYTIVLAVVLAAAGAVTYGIVRRQTIQTNDDSMRMTAQQFVSGLTGEAAEARGVLQLRSANEILTDFRDKERAIVVLRGDGHEFAAQTTAVANSLDRTWLAGRVASRAFGFSSTAGGGGTRVLLLPVRIGAAPFVIVVAQPLARQRAMLHDVRNAMFATIPLALLVASLGGYLLARKSLEPVARMTAQARRITATNLSERIEAASAEDELGTLAATLNDLLSRLESSFAAQRRFMADASHELRSPVTILQGELDVTLSRGDRDAAEYRDSLEVMRRSTGRLARIVRDLFLLARSDAGDVPFKREPVYVSDIIAQTVRGLRTIADERDVALIAECDGDVQVEGDEDLLQRMVGNLVENAIRYTLPGSEVRIRCVHAGGVRIEVADRGPGVPSHLRERIFERFFRVDPARSHDPSPAAGSGAGLGLPIARWIAAAHGGTLTLEKSDANGSVFVATLPGNGGRIDATVHRAPPAVR